MLPRPGGAELMLTNGTSGTAEFIDWVTGKSLASVKVGKGPNAAIYDAKSGLAIGNPHAGGTVSLVDPKKYAAVAEIQDGETALEYAAIDPAGPLFVSREDATEIAEIDLTGFKLMKRIKLVGFEGPTGLAYLPVSKPMIVHAPTAWLLRSIRRGRSSTARCRPEKAQTP